MICVNNLMVGSINRKYSLFQRFTMILTFYFYTDRFQLSNWFLSAGSNSHLNYGQRGIKLEQNEKGLYITVFNCFVFKTNVVKPSPCFLSWPCLQFDSVF